MKKILASLTTINWLIIIVLINVILSFYPFWRLDLTESKIHSLSKSTQKIVRELPDVVTIKVFLTADLPAEAKVIAEDLKTILEEVKRINPTRLKITYVDPNQDEEARIEAERLGIQPLQFSSIRNDKFEMQTGYFGLSMNFGDKKEIFPVAGDTGNLEYFLMAGVKKLISDKNVKVGVITESEEGLEILGAVLNKSYQLVTEDEAEVLVMVGMQGEMDDKRINQIRQWLEAKKGLIVLADKFEVGSGLRAEMVENKKFEELLAEYGIKILPKIVADGNGTIASFRGQNGTFLTRYPYWVGIKSENTDTKNPVMSGLSALMLPWASPLEIKGEAKYLFGSDLAVLTDSSNLAPGVEIEGVSEPKKEVLGAINSQDAKLVVIGDSDLIKDEFVVNSQQNMSLILNLIDYLGGDSDLMEIRGKQIGSYPIREVDETTKNVIKGVNMAIPILILGVSLLVYRVRRKNVKK